MGKDKESRLAGLFCFLAATTSTAGVVFHLFVHGFIFYACPSAGGVKN